LPGWQLERTANLCYSPDTGVRRLYSRLAIRNELRRARRMPLLRLSLHPQDARVPAVLAHWQRLVVEALAERRPVTKHAWAASVRQPGGLAPSAIGDPAESAPVIAAPVLAAPARATP